MDTVLNTKHICMTVLDYSYYIIIFQLFDIYTINEHANTFIKYIKSTKQ